MPAVIPLQQQLCTQQVSPAQRADRGRPVRLCSLMLWMGLLWCLLQGMRHQLDLWRLLCWEGFWQFVPVPLTDQAIYNRLAREGVKTLEQLWLATSQLLAQRVAPSAAPHLAPFACEVVALDETILDPIARLLAPLRGLPWGDPGLLPGKIAALFAVRLHQWRDFRGLCRCQRAL